MMTENDEIKRIPLDAVTKMKQANTGHHLSDVIQGLIENSIDAHCSQILIYLENDGLSSIKVTDDGVGIPKSSLPNVCRFHYTSKIKEITKTEILHGKSFGFMGSFLANLSCVSTVKISTKYHKEDKSSFAIYEYNIMTKNCDSFEVDNGTCVDIVNYLYNFPNQRLKIRKNAKEINKMIDTIAKYAIVYSWIKFEVISNDRPDLPLLKTPGNSDLFTNLITMHKLQEPLKSFYVSSFEKFDENVEVIMILSNPRYNYSTTNNTLLRAVFLNGRLVSVPSLKNSLNKIYQDVRFNMNNYFLNNPYFIFIKAPEIYTNDVFNEDDNDSEFNDNDDSEYNNLLKEEKCYFQKFRYFDFIKKLVQECYQIITDSRSPPKDYQIANDIRRVETVLINEHLCNPPRATDTGKILFHHQAQQQPQTSQAQNPHGIQVQSSIPVVSSSGMQNILASPLQQKQPSQQSNQIHSTYLPPPKTLQDQQSQQKQQSQSTSPFLATSRLSSQQSIHDHPHQLQQPSQVQVQIQPKAQTIHTPKITVHNVAKTVIKKSISPASSTIFTSSQQQSPSSSQQTTRETPSSITSVIQSSNSDQKIQRNPSIQTISQPSQNQTPVNQSPVLKPASRVTDINDLLTNNPSPQVLQSSTKRVKVRKITTAPLLLVSANGGQNQQSQQQQNNSTLNSSAQNVPSTPNVQTNVPATPVTRVHKVVVTQKNPS